MTGLILDTGALIAVGRGDRRTVTLLERARQREEPVLVPSACIAQAWRGGERRTRLAVLLRARATLVAELDGATARRVGELLGATGSSDVVDGHVAVLALRTGHAVLTSDPDDIRRLAPTALVHAT